MWAYLEIPRSGCLLFLHLQEGDALGNEIYLSTYHRSCSFRIYMVLWAYLEIPRSGFQIPRGGCLLFLHLQEGELLWKTEIYLSKYPGSCSFRIYMVMGVYLQNPRSDGLYFPAPSGGRRPLENEIYLSKYLTSCSFRIYVVIGVYLQNPRRSS